MSGISTHVLDISLGSPAAGISVLAEAESVKEGWQTAGRGITDSDGRITELVKAPLRAGIYRLTFETGAYFAARSQKAFYPRVMILFSVEDGGQRYHVPLLVSPFGYSTYRGS